MDTIASFVGYAIVAIIAGLPFAWTIGKFCNRMVMIRTHGSDTNLDEIPATGFGAIGGFIFGMIVAVKLLEAKSFGLTVGYLLLIWFVLALALHFVKEWIAKINNIVTSKGDKPHRPF